jgi:hypothetical protein
MGLEESLGGLTMVKEAEVGLKEKEELPSGERESRFGVTFAVFSRSCLLPLMAVEVDMVAEVAVGV